MSARDDRGTPQDLDAAQADGDPAMPAGVPDRAGMESLDTGPAEAGSPSQGEGLSDHELVEMVRDPDHRT
ncbi:MAG: hypothetical protein M3P95_10905 [Actinomycetota bacterium]|jgi:hypothetical protein|nr:hypothetical protein [Actinomycetota bacterium]